jgi:glycosyltransferase involved in cell wall biosynthesis
MSDIACAVFLTTFNGSAFLSEQISSILNQNSIDVHIYAIDDFSSDDSVAILETFTPSGRITILRNTQNIGVNRIYYQFMDFNIDHEYIAFADQDDVWHPDKLKNLISNFDSEMPTLIFCGRQVFSNTKRHLSAFNSKISSLSWQNAVVQNVVPLNCIVVNKSGLNLMWAFRNEANYYFDSWTYLIFSIFGKILYYDSKLVYYRIHETNLVGIRGHNRRISRIGSLYKTFEQAVQLVNMTEDFKYLSNPRFTKLKETVEIVFAKRDLSKLLRIQNLEITRQSRLETLVVKFLLFFYTDKRPKM